MQRGPGSVRDAESRVVGGLVGGEVPKAAGANGERVSLKLKGAEVFFLFYFLFFSIG